MKVSYVLGLLLCGLTSAVALTGCSISVSTADQAYESCVPGDVCYSGTYCTQTSLPSGYSGALCTTACQTSAECPQDLTNFDAICVNSQCYIQCPTGGGNCPYGTACFSFSDQTGAPINLCTP